MCFLYLYLKLHNVYMYFITEIFILFMYLFIFAKKIALLISDLLLQLTCLRSVEKIETRLDVRYENL